MRNIKIQLYIIKNKRDIKDVFYKRYFQKKISSEVTNIHNKTLLEVTTLHKRYY